ncbi:unnamed protein product [Anisakis simplex]|uniref:28S ribosomal protein S30, mitochondrial n=1 Tax=Anisakis simplex TaxID=6269 RepID=A0A0M3K0P5_ANISI|nr:unnamed protein product [Anisakis simplex]
MRQKVISLNAVSNLLLQCNSNYSKSTATATKTALAVRRHLKPPYYRRTIPAYPATHKLKEEFPNAGDLDGSGPRLYDYEQMGDIVRSLPKISDKIDFVNPYERPWTRFEKTWHRPWHPFLMSPRKAWNVPSVPRYFDSLNFYKYITKTRLVDGLNQWYEGIVPPTTSFQMRLIESLIANLESNQTDIDESERVTILLQAVFDAALLTLAQNVHRLQNCRISATPRCESFWVRAGFMQIRKLGELAFVLRDQLAAHIRTKQPLRPLFKFSNEDELNAEVFDETVDVKQDVIYSPKVFNMWPDEKPLWQCAGFEPDSGDEYKSGLLAIKDVSSLNDLLAYWKVEPGEERSIVQRESLTATAIVSLFSWLNAQAHSLGFTQYNDIEWPLVSQMILSDGRDFFFAIAQLNTIAINIDVKGFVNNRSNVCYVEGPLRLYDRFDSRRGNFYYLLADGTEVEGLNPQVMTRILQMFIKE